MKIKKRDVLTSRQTGRRITIMGNQLYIMEKKRKCLNKGRIQVFSKYEKIKTPTNKKYVEVIDTKQYHLSQRFYLFLKISSFDTFYST